METLKNQELLCESLMIGLEKKQVNYKENLTFLFERAKMIGMMEILKSQSRDISEFTWIYNAI